MAGKVVPCSERIDVLFAGRHEGTPGGDLALDRRAVHYGRVDGGELTFGIVVEAGHNDFASGRLVLPAPHLQLFEPVEIAQLDPTDAVLRLLGGGGIGAVRVDRWNRRGGGSFLGLDHHELHEGPDRKRDADIEASAAAQPPRRSACAGREGVYERHDRRDAVKAAHEDLAAAAQAEVDQADVPGGGERLGGALHSGAALKCVPAFLDRWRPDAGVLAEDPDRRHDHNDLRRDDEADEDGDVDAVRRPLAGACDGFEDQVAEDDEVDEDADDERPADPAPDSFVVEEGERP